MSGRALVTGASGMLGSHIVETLQDQAWEVRALVRPASRVAWLEGAGVGLARGRLEDVDSLVVAAAGADVVFHAAAAIGAGGGWACYRDANVVGTRNVLEAAARTGARVVHVSSTAVYGAARYHAEPTDERTELPVLPRHDLYGRSKQAAEGLVMQAHRVGRVWGAVVRPPLMYGRRDRQLAPRLGPMLERGFFPRIAGGSTTLTMVHARHVAEGAVLAATSDVAGGKAYLLADDFPLTVTELVRCAELAFGRRIHAPRVPMLVGRAAFATLAALLSVTGRRALAQHAAGTFAMLTRDNPFSSERARRELGWAPSIVPSVGLTEALREWIASRAEARTGRRPAPRPTVRGRRRRAREV